MFTYWHFLVCNYNYSWWFWSENHHVKMISLHLCLFKCFFHSLLLQLQRRFTQFIENMLYTLHATYIKHNFYVDFLLTDLQFKMNKISHCSDFDSLLLKHELQTFCLQYACVLQLISSLITLTCITVFSNYINNVFN